MTKEQFAKFLETATDAQLASIAAVIEGKEAPAVKAAQDAQATAEAALKAANEKAAADLKAANEAAATAQEAALKAACDAATKAALETPEVKSAMELAGVRKAATIKALVETKRCDKSEADLKAMSQAESPSTTAARPRVVWTRRRLCRPPRTWSPRSRLRTRRSNTAPKQEGRTCRSSTRVPRATGSPLTALSSSGTGLLSRSSATSPRRRSRGIPSRRRLTTRTMIHMSPGFVARENFSSW